MTARRAFSAFVLVVLALFASPLAQAQVSLTTLGVPYTQNFDTLPASGSTTWTNNSNIPGWFHARTGTGTTIVANDGSSNAGNLYSYGTGTATDRALGSLGSGNAAIGNLFWGVRLQNNTGATITQLDVSYTGEQWRNSAAAAQTIAFSYLVGSPTVTGSLAEFQSAGTAVPSLDFTSPITGGVAGALNGNLAANQVVRTFSITGLSIPNGTEVMLRWSDPDHTGADHGLSIDGFSVTPQGSIANAPVIPTCATPVTTTTGTATTQGVSATDADGTVVSATITGITPSDPGTITLTGFTPAGGVGGTANATLDVSNTTPTGTYNVTIQWANNDGSPQTANCVVVVNVNAPPTIAKIHDVQGNGAATPIPGASVTIEGVVTGDFQPVTNDNRLSGFFVQEEDADWDADPATSEGIFVFCSACPTNVAEGQKVQVTGTVSEFNNLTEITATTAGSVVITNAGNNLAQVTASTIDLPVVGVINDFYEPKESMLITFVDTLTVSEYFEQARYGRIELYEGTRPRTFNESNPPSVAGFAAHNDNLDRRRVYLDDDDNVENSVLNLTDGQQFVFHPQANGGLSARNATNTGPGVQGTDFFRGGDTVSNLTGILHYSFSGGTSPNEWRVRPVAASPATFTAVNVRPPTPPAVGGAIRGASVNVLNYFTTLNVRGADSTAELNRQRERTSIVLCALNPDVAGLMEIENHATNATITDLLGDVNTRCGGTHPYTFVNTGGALGTDEIRVMLIYRTGVLSPVGSPLTDSDPVHNRPPTAQTFDVVDALNPAFGQRFTAIANHSKSKGCGGASGGDADQNDGQACYSATRLAQANRLITWINGTVIPAAGDPDILMVGDFNAYPQETSAATISAAGFSDLETAFLGSAAYSYLFDGQIGHIDYAWASTSLASQVTGIAPWHINADENPLFDYNDEIKDGAAEQTFEEKPDGSALAIPRVMFQAATAQRASDHDPVLVGLFAVADVSLTKTLDTAGPYIPGQSVTYTITVSNAGPDQATNIGVTDTPTNLTITNVTGACASFSPCTIPTLNVGANAVITVTATINAAGPFDNSATATGTQSDPSSSNNTDNAGDTAVASADVSVSKTLDTAGPYAVGQSVTFTITVSNGGPSTATNIGVTDTPTNLTITNVTGACASFSPCTIASLASGANTAITVTATINGAGSFDNSASASANEADPNSGNNTDNAGDTATTSADVSVSKTLDTAGPYNAGQAVTYTITVANGGPSTATNIGVTDTPTNLTITNVSGACTSFSPCTIASLASGANAVITVTATIDAAGAFDNSASASANESDPNSGNNSDNAGDTASTSADLAVTKTDSPDPVDPGNNITYTITLTNNGPSTATSATFSDTLPAGTTFVSLSTTGGWSCSTPAVGATGTVSCTNPSFLVTVDFFTLVVKVDASVPVGTVLSNTATVGSSTTDPNNANDSDTTGTTVGAGSADMGVSKSDTPDPISAGSLLTYNITATNAGPSDAANVTFSDTIPANTVYITSDLPAGWSCSTPGVGGTGTVTCTIASFPAGGNAVFAIHVTVNDSTPNGTVITNTADISTTTPDSNNTNDSSTTTTTVNPVTTFTATKSVAGTFLAGSTVTYTVVLTNNMGHTQQNNFGNEFADILPSGLALTGANATSGTILTILPSNIVTWNGSIPNGGTITITITATITASSGTVSNQGNAIIDTDNTGNNETGLPTDDPLTGAPNDATVFTVIPSADVQVTKTDTPDPISAGSLLSYTITVTNAGPSDAANVSLSDTIPTGTVYITQENPPAGWSCSTPGVGGTGTYTCSIASLPSGASATFIFHVTVNAALPNGTIITNTATVASTTSDPNSGNNSATATTTVNPVTNFTATKSVSGSFGAGTTVTYTVVLTNNMGHTQGDNFGNEFADILPSGLALTGATATSGTILTILPSNIVTWNGSIPNGGTVTITITATITASSGTVSNQGNAIIDTDNSGNNETGLPTDDPSTGTPNDPTVFTVIPSPDSDGDGVNDVVEQGAPNSGDGNGDGIPDYTQGTVASIPAATGSGYLTLQSSCQLQQVEVVNEESLPADLHHRYPHGLIAFRAPCSSATFSLFIYGSGAVSSYRKYGPNPPGGSSMWYQLPGATFQVVTVGSLHPRRVDFSLTDGAVGDDTPVDGVIVDQGGPADPDAAVPTLDEWALIALAAMLAAVAMLAMKK